MEVLALVYDQPLVSLLLLAELDLNKSLILFLTSIIVFLGFFHKSSYDNSLIWQVIKHRQNLLFRDFFLGLSPWLVA